MNLSTLKDKIAKLPQQPGVYFFSGSKKEILYIGKATNLRSRVSSYFRGVEGGLGVAGRSEWISLMISQVDDIEFEQTDSVLEALILESNLIKKHLPKYNTLEKDDKSFSYFMITKEEFPRVIIIRGTDLLKMSQSKFPISNKIQSTNDKTQKKFKYGDVAPGKTYGPYTSKLQMQIALKIIRRIFPFHALKQKSEKGCLDFQLGKCPGPYAGAITKEDYKKNIRGIKMILEGKKKSLVKTLEKEMLAFSRKDEFEKAAATRNKIYALEHIRDVALMTRDFDQYSTDNIQQTTEEIRNTENEIRNTRVEAYDISNISGEHAVGSMVVFENGKPNKNEYRKFKIKTVVGSNDVAMMKEVLLRRFKNDWAMPDLILLDGGQGHANMMSDLVVELGLDILVVAVAKGVTRKNLNFQFPMSNKIPMSQFPMELQKFLDDKNLVKSIMDEAHRFAITYHRKVRGRNSLL